MEPYDEPKSNSEAIVPGPAAHDVGPPRRTFPPRLVFAPRDGPEDHVLSSGHDRGVPNRQR